MIRDNQYAFFSLRTYSATQINRPTVPAGWHVLEEIPDLSSGFSAGVYQNDDGDVVIAYTGTSVEEEEKWSARAAQHIIRKARSRDIDENAGRCPV